MSLPLRDHFHIHALLPKPLDAHRAQIALGEVRKPEALIPVPY